VTGIALFSITGPKIIFFWVGTERGCRIISKDHGEQSQIFDGFKGGKKGDVPKAARGFRDSET
jgi:hypothetical protein